MCHEGEPYLALPGPLVTLVSQTIALAGDALACVRAAGVPVVTRSASLGRKRTDDEMNPTSHM